MAPSRAWRLAVGRYLGAAAVGNLVWELAQMPFYTLWETGSIWEVAFAALHCTVGDVLIAGVSLTAGLLLFGAPNWPCGRFLRVAATAVLFGLGVTVLVEHVATTWGIWTYSELMPVLPGLGTGLAPLTQWVVVPLLAFTAANLPPRSKLGLVRTGEGLDLPTLAIITSAAAPDHLALPTRRAS